MSDVFKGALSESIENGIKAINNQIVESSNETDTVLAQLYVNQEYQACLMELQNNML